MDSHRTPLTAFLRSFAFALSGIAHTFRTQRNMRVHLLAAVSVMVAGVWLSISSVEWAIITLAMGFVFAAETLNTVVENLVDLVSPAYDPLAKIAKDAAAGAVLITAVFAALVGIFVFAPRVVGMIGR